MAARKKPKPGMEIDQEYELVELASLETEIREHPQNPKIGDTALIDESIEENGWYGAITVQRSTSYVIAGNHRFRQAVARGATHIPVIWKDVDDETALKILLVDNKGADAGTYDEGKLEEALSALPTLTGTGYGLAALEEAEEAADAEQEASDDAPDPEPEDEVPDDKYEPSFGVMLVVDSEDAQRTLYEMLTVMKDKEFDEMDIQMRVVAV